MDKTGHLLYKVSSNVNMETAILIREYEPKDHDDVRRIFGGGISEHVKNGIKESLKNVGILGKLALIFVLGAYFGSIKHGLIALVVAFFLLCMFVYACYNFYVR